MKRREAVIAAAVLQALARAEAPGPKTVTRPRPVGEEPAYVFRRREDRTGLQQTRDADLNAVGVLRPLIPEDLMPDAANPGEGFERFMRALQYQKGARTPSLDVVE